MEIEKIAKQILQNKPNTWEHTERVVELCTEFSTRLDADVNMKMLHAAAWLHDVGKTVDNESHSKKRAVQQALEKYKDDLTGDMDTFFMKTLIAMIRVHKGNFDPPEGYELESAILRICDKLDKYHQAQAKAEKGDEKEDEGDDKEKWREAAQMYKEAVGKYQKAVEKYQEATQKCNDSMMKIKDVLHPDNWDAFENAYAQTLAQILR